MKNKSTNIIKLGILLAIFAFSFNPSKAQRFEKHFGYNVGAYQPQMKAVAHRANGNNLISIHNQSGTGQGVAGIAEINPQGDTLWFKQFNNSATTYGDNFVNFIRELPNHTLFMAGGTHFSSGYYHSAFWLADSTGNITAYSRMLFPSNLNITLTDIDVAPDGSFYFAGSHYDVYSGGVTFYTWTEPAYGKLNSDLSLAWGRTWGTGNHANNNHNSGVAQGIKVCPDGNIVVMGTDAIANNGSGFFEIAKVTSGGSMIWKYEKPMPAYSYPSGMDVSNNGDIYVAANLVNAPATYGVADVMLTKFTTSGSQVWCKSYGTNQLEQANKIRFDEANNAVLLAGQHYYNGSEYYAWFAKIDTAGTPAFSKLFGLPGIYDTFSDVITTGSNYLLAGDGGSYGGYLVQTDFAGTTTCTMLDLPLQSGNYASSFSPGVSHTGRVFTVAPYTTGYYHYSLTSTTNCYACSNVIQNSYVTACGSYFIGGATQTSSGTFNDTLSSFGGCDSVVITNLTIQQPPTASFAGTNQNICINSASLTGNVPVTGTGLWTLVSGTGTIVSPTSANTTVNGLGVGNNVFQWTISNGVCAASSSSVTIHLGATSGNSISPSVCNVYTLNGQTYTSSGTYLQTLTNASGCDSLLSITLTVNTSPTVTYTQNPSLVCINWAPLALTGGSPAGGTYVGSGVSANTFDPSAAGVGTFPIQYSYTDVNGCSGVHSSSITVDACTGVNGSGVGSQESGVYPNPSSGQFQISNSKFQIESIKIYNILGEAVYQSEITNPKSEISIDISALAKGIYFIKINTATTSFTQKLIKN